MKLQSYCLRFGLILIFFIACLLASESKDIGFKPKAVAILTPPLSADHATVPAGRKHWPDNGVSCFFSVLKVEDCLQSLDLAVVSVKDVPIVKAEGGGASSDAAPEALSLITDVVMEHGDGDAGAAAGGVVSWCPPTNNWNPWIGGNIDEGETFIKIFFFRIYKHFFYRRQAVNVTRRVF